MGKTPTHFLNREVRLGYGMVLDNCCTFNWAGNLESDELMGTVWARIKWIEVDVKERRCEIQTSHCFFIFVMSKYLSLMLISSHLVFNMIPNFKVLFCRR